MDAAPTAARLRARGEEPHDGLLQADVALSLVVVVSFVLLAMSSGTVTMQPLFFEDTPAEVTQEVIRKLDAKAVPYELRSDRLYVKREDADRLRVELIGEGITPEGKDPYTWVFEPDFTATPAKQSLEWQVTVQRRLERMISTIEAIRSAQVAITWVKDKDFVFQENRERPKASVRVNLKQGKSLKAENVLSIARLVSGAVKNLEPKDVWIVDAQGNPHEVPDEDSPDATATKYFEIERQKELALEKAAERVLTPLLGPSVVAKAKVKIDTKTKTDIRTGIDPTRTSETEIDKKKRTSENRDETAAPGVQGNLPRTPEPVGGIGSKETEEESRTKLAVGEQNITESTPPGTVVDSSIMVVADYEEILRDPALPKDKIGKLSDVEKPARYQARVAELTNALAKATMIDPLKIAFVAYAPAEIEPIPILTWQQEVLGFIREHGDQMALVFIACVGMLMIYRMVKTAVPKDILAEIARLRGEIASEEAMGPEAAMAQAADFKSTQLREKVREIIKKNPRSAANLLRRWARD
ncbi:MAG: flagellar M-ring protein FliF [Planctomycetes bacterium]|nr:flagellar M-ring protein FliF [Planctomycetota bacterium]